MYPWSNILLFLIVLYEHYFPSSAKYMWSINCSLLENSQVFQNAIIRLDWTKVSKLSLNVKPTIPGKITLKIATDQINQYLTADTLHETF